MSTYKIGFFGAGKMAEGILSAIADKKSVIMAEKVDARADELVKKYGVTTTDDVKGVAETAQLIFLAVRPQDMDAVAAEVKPLLTAKQTLVSIVAGKTLAKLRKAFGPKVNLIRVMPNLALRANAGMCAITAPAKTPAKDVKAVEKILGGAGATAILKEKDFDAVTALSGSGPAYFAYMEEAMVEGGVKLGLKPDVARLASSRSRRCTARRSSCARAACRFVRSSRASARRAVRRPRAWSRWTFPRSRRSWPRRWPPRPSVPRSSRKSAHENRHLRR